MYETLWAVAVLAVLALGVSIFGAVVRRRCNLGPSTHSP